MAGHAGRPPPGAGLRPSGAGRQRLGARHRAGPLAQHPGVRRRRRPPALPRALHGRTPRRGRTGLARLRRRLLPVRCVAGRRLRRRHRGLLLRPHLRGHRRAAGEGRAPAGRAGGVQPARRPHGEAQPHGRVPALGLHRPRPEPRRHLAPGPPRAHRPGPPAPAVGGVRRGGERVGHPALSGLRRRRRPQHREDRHDGRRPGAVHRGAEPRRRREPAGVAGHGPRTEALVALGPG